jgi:hypothetical protein
MFRRDIASMWRLWEKSMLSKGASPMGKSISVIKLREDISKVAAAGPQAQVKGQRAKVKRQKSWVLCPTMSEDEFLIGEASS